VFVKALGEGVFELGLKDVKNRNKLTREMCSDLMAVLSQTAEEPALKVLVLTGAKDIFCAGAALAVLREVCVEKKDIKDLLLPAQIIGFPMPVVAALEGSAVGGGLMLALCCDILIAAEERRFGLNFTTLGFTPGMGATQLVPAVAGHYFATEMLLTGKLYKGRELRGRGLFNAVVPSEQVREVALDIAFRIAERPRHVIAMVKSTLALTRARALEDALSREQLLHEFCFAHPDTTALIEDQYL
jgi:polyketide biosynthesis enoyl-CoA hydratase PksI